jgi:hypothetical protein
MIPDRTEKYRPRRPSETHCDQYGADESVFFFEGDNPPPFFDQDVIFRIDPRDFSNGVHLLIACLRRAQDNTSKITQIGPTASIDGRTTNVGMKSFVFGTDDPSPKSGILAHWVSDAEI